MRICKLIFPLMILFLAACAPMRGEPLPATPAAPSAADASPVPASATPEAFTPTTPAATPQPPPETSMPAAYPDLGPAPEIAGDVWLNADAPLRLADLHGKVTLIDMWTFG